MTKEEKIILIVRNSDFTYEELEKLPVTSIDSFYVAHVLERKTTLLFKGRKLNYPVRRIWQKK